MSLFAIIGSTTPTDEQVARIKRSVLWVRDNHPDATVISGCAIGTDGIALREAKSSGLKTIGCVPWKKYEPETQKVCDQIICLEECEPLLKQAALDSVTKYHPVPGHLKQGPFKLHARNYLIVYQAVRVIAFPSYKIGGGGTGQGIRIAYGMNIPLWCIDPKCEHVSAEKYLKKER